MNILITGGTGTIGNAYVKFMLEKQFTGKIVIYSRDEHKQELMRRKFNDNEQLRFLIGDIRDKDRLRLALNDIDTVVHAAALKIVPTAEYNPFEALKTNTIGAQNLIDCCIESDTVHSVVAISTDKAVYPINLYGATKLCAEKLFLAANNVRGKFGPRFNVVRYGNVAGSNGSIIPLFRKQVSERRPITITDSEMTRFWITEKEACETIQEAININNGKIIVPIMRSFYVTDLACAIGGNDYPTEVIGTRPGEKTHETILTQYELENLTVKNNYFIIGEEEIKIIIMPFPDYFPDHSTSRSAEKMSIFILRKALDEIPI